MISSTMSGTSRRLRIYVFVESYPHRFKPYYDVQFRDFLAKGHDVRVFALARGEAGSTDPNEQPPVRLYFPDELRLLPSWLPRVVGGFASRPLATSRGWRRTMREQGRVAERVKRFARVATLPADAPDFCLVHGLGPMSCLPWLKHLYPHAVVAAYYHGEKPEGAGSIGENKIRSFLGAADVLFTNTGFSSRRLLSRGAEPSQVVVLPVGFDLTRYPEAGERGYRPGGVLRLVSAGRLSVEKGLRHALEAVATLCREGVQLHYTIAGEGPLREELVQTTARLGVESNVTFAGTLAHGEVIELFGRSDALLLPSIAIGGVEETQATVVQEAMLMQAIPITSRTGGVPESLPPEMVEMSVAQHDPAALASVLRSVSAAPETELQSLARRNLEWVRERYDIRRLNEELLARSGFQADGSRAAQHHAGPGA